MMVITMAGYALQTSPLGAHAKPPGPISLIQPLEAAVKWPWPTQMNISYTNITFILEQEK